MPQTGNYEFTEDALERNFQSAIRVEIHPIYQQDGEIDCLEVVLEVSTWAVMTLRIMRDEIYRKAPDEVSAIVRDKILLAAGKIIQTWGH